jgi:hypothetical protein
MTGMNVSPRGMNVNRLLIVLALAGLLVACTDQGTGESDQPIGSAASSGAMSSEGTTGSASAACEEAFAPIAEMGLTEFSELGDLADEVEATVESCESVADWTAGAQGAIGAEVNPNAAAFLLGTTCDDPSLADTPVCEELAAS